MGKRLFRVRWDVEAEVELDDHVIDVVDDEWRSYLYDLNTPGEIAEHVANNLIRGARLSILDGWADQPDTNARIIDVDWDFILAEEYFVFGEVGGFSPDENCRDEGAHD